MKLSTLTFMVVALPWLCSCTLLLHRNPEADGGGPDGAYPGDADADGDADGEVSARCGNGEVELEAGELCDDGQLNSDTRPDACRTDCTLHRCGDGVADHDEACDDGNDVDDDNCSNECVVVLADLCQPCVADGDCGRAEDLCSVLDDGSYCTIDCTEGGSCPDGFTCQMLTSVGGVTASQCGPELGVCSGCVDADRDGYGLGTECEGFDCDDTNASINPAAIETCDGVDNNCDGGESDAIDMVTLFRDEDRDGFGDPSTEALECPGDGFSDNGDDCDDGNASIYPGAEEVCHDAVDNDCDGSVDEECPCEGDECGDTCAFPLEIVPPADGRSVTYTGSTSGAGDDFDSHCGGAGSNDRVFVIEVTIADNYAFDTDVVSGDFDTIVSARTVCDDPDTELGCSDDDGNPGSVMSWLELWLEPGVYYVILDGKGGASGNYSLEVHRN